MKVFKMVIGFAYTVPVIMYTIYTFGNPDGFRWGGNNQECWVHSSSDECMTKEKAKDLDAINMTSWVMITLLVGFIISIMVVLHQLHVNRMLGFMGVYMVSTLTDSYWSAIWAIYLIVLRASHGGRVIFGDLSVCDGSSH